MRGKHQKRKGLFRKGELIALGVMISFVLILFAVTGSFAVIKNTFFPNTTLQPSKQVNQFKLLAMIRQINLKNIKIG